jgi:hypothetical protein
MLLTAASGRSPLGPSSSASFSLALVAVAAVVTERCLDRQSVAVRAVVAAVVWRRSFFPPTSARRRRTAPERLARLARLARAATAATAASAATQPLAAARSPFTGHMAAVAERVGTPRRLAAEVVPVSPVREESAPRAAEQPVRTAAQRISAAQLADLRVPLAAPWGVTPSSVAAVAAVAATSLRLPPTVLARPEARAGSDRGWAVTVVPRARSGSPACWVDNWDALARAAVAAAHQRRSRVLAELVGFRVVAAVVAVPR